MTNVPVVSYARISADIRRDEHGVQDQHRLNRETAERHGWTVVHEYTDNDKSAAKADVVRDDFEAILRALRAGELPNGTAVQGVVIVAEDRLARRPGDYERFVEAITSQDGRVFADARGTKDLYSEDTESMGLFGAVISKMEVRKMQRRMRRSHRTRAEQGLPVGGTRPFGWKPDRLTLDPEEAPLVRQAVLDLIAGRSLHSITNQWRREGAKTSLGNEWTTPSLKLNVQNPRICGWREINGELVRDPAGNPVVGQWEPIVTPEQWMAVKNIFDARKGHYIHRDGRIGHILTPDFREPNYLLTGFLRCGRAKPDGSLCNTSLRVTHSKDCVQHIYICPGKTVGGCGGLGRRGDMVDLFISEAVLAKLEQVQLAASATPAESGRARRSTRAQRLALKSCASSGRRATSPTSSSSQQRRTLRSASPAFAPRPKDSPPPLSVAKPAPTPTSTTSDGAGTCQRRKTDSPSPSSAPTSTKPS
ncbi:recombinase family protein [Nonomuraea longispora]|uniref:Recombinase family protein n=1 Tax=Nonomuraea longispora TaxID=1848320 RepID=A0A4R4NSA0_9ACTN|nr:recombinase family protein [Nonomuraea longispora]TDC10860.1 recombinase family protein [Nonomuraea longispora]